MQSDLIKLCLIQCFSKRESSSGLSTISAPRLQKAPEERFSLVWREMSALLERDSMQQSNRGNEDVHEGEAERRRDRLGQTVSKTEAGS